MEAYLSDTIVCDTTTLNNFASNGNYDYNSELQKENESLLERFLNAIGEWFDDLFSSAPDVSETLPKGSSGMWSGWYYVVIAILVIAILVCLYVMYKKKMFIFKRRKKKEEEDYEVLEDTIYGIDFDNDINLAIKAGNYKEAVRLSYLQCLRLLSDKSLIEWRIFKTPTQYTHEYKDDVFAQFTRQYVFLRYSGCNVTASHFNEICDQKKEIEDSVADITAEPAQPQEGGDNED